MPARALLIAFAAALPFVNLLFAQPPARPPRKVALLIGVNEYTKRAGLQLDNLQFAEPDVTALAKELTKAGFEVTTLRGSDGIDPKKKVTGKAAYFAALTQTLTGVTKADTVLVAFSGHGAQAEVGGKESPFFCPADADPTDVTTLISINDVLAKLNKDGGGHNLVLVDACRNVVDLNRGARSGINGRLIENLPEGTAVFFSCSGRQKARETDKMFPADGGKKGHGVFFHFVLEGLRGAGGATDAKGRVTWERLVPFVKEQVKDANAAWFADVKEAERQVPFAIGSLGDVPPLVSDRVERFAYIVNDTEEKTGERRVLTLNLGGDVTMDFVRIEGDEFLMGAPYGEKDAEADEKPQRKVKLSTFYLGKYEVTQAQYKAITGKDPSHFKGPMLPVEQMSWNDAVAFAAKVSEQTGRKVSLPSEAQWEFACRAGTKTPFHFGSKLNGDHANHDGKNGPYGTDVQGKYHEKTVDVGSYKANPWGVHDMHGNVSEWCADYYGPYNTIASSVNPIQSIKQSKVSCLLRGGSWSYNGRNCRAASRFRNPPDFAYWFFGCRLCVGLD